MEERGEQEQRKEEGERRVRTSVLALGFRGGMVRLMEGHEDISHTVGCNALAIKGYYLNNDD